MSFPRSESRPLPRKIRILLCLAAAAAAALFLWRPLSQLLFQIALAALLAFAASPLCKRLERRLPPGLAALLSLLSFLAALVLFLTILIPRLISQFSQALSAVPQLIGILQNMLKKVTSTSLFASISPYIAPSGDLLQKTGDMLLSIIPRAVQWLGRIANRMLRAFLAPALAFYFLRDRENFCFQLSLLIPLSLRKRTMQALKEMRREVTGYYRGQLLVGASVGLLTALALFLLGTPSALALGLLMGVCDLIPYVGPWLGAIPIVLFSLPQGMHAALLSLLAVLAVQQIESLFLSPHFMSGATGLHPAYVLLLLSGSGLLFGISGMLLALPVFVCLRGAIRALQCAAQSEQ